MFDNTKSDASTGFVFEKLFSQHIICFAQSAKHFPLSICCEKYMFDNTKSDASTGFVFDKLFSQHIYEAISFDELLYRVALLVLHH
jgi:hypothetical protein